MKQCPRCKEIIGDALEVCPICHTEFTEKQMEEMKKAIESAEVQKLIHEKQRLARFHKKRVIMGWLMFSGIGILIISPFFFVNVSATVGFILLIGGFTLCIGGLIFGLISGATNCPYCDALLFRNYGNHCAYYEKKYR